MKHIPKPMSCVAVFLGLLACHAAQAQVTGSGTAGRIPRWTGATSLGDSVLIQSGTNLGIGIAAPTSPLTVIGNAGLVLRVDNSSTAASAYAVRGTITSSMPGAGSVGVRGINNATGSTGAGVYGSHGGSGFGIYGYAPNGRGVYGTSSTGYGVFGLHSNTSSGGDFPGVYGESAAPVGYGVQGIAPGSDATGVYGKALGSGESWGVWGIGGDRGVYGRSDFGAGIYGISSEGYAGYFDGDVVVTGNLNAAGTLTKPAGSFKIDHPLDPANKYLSHSFVESPDMMNIYNGNISTDAEGNATVTLPDYFTALNSDYRYQLTCLGQFAQAIVAREIEDNRFVIRTDKPHVKVSWQVTGIRHDAYAQARRIQVEEDKGDQRGTYLHPELVGQPKEKGATQARHPGLRRAVKGNRDVRVVESRP